MQLYWLHYSNANQLLHKNQQRRQRRIVVKGKDSFGDNYDDCDDDFGDIFESVHGRLEAASSVS